MNEAGMDRMMPEKCPQCGATLPAGALAGLCPACLLQQGAATDTATRSNAKPFVPLTVEEVARHFPGLEILELLGRGGMGAVYKARQKQLDRLVALKILPPRSGDDSAFAERFTREAKALARLNHPGIVTLYEFGVVEGRAGSPLPAGGEDGSQRRAMECAPYPEPPLYYFLMEFVDGVNLRQLLAGSRIAPREALAIVPQICDALQYAHDQGIVHRDVKPDNILLDRRGRVKVADFGLAKLVDAQTDAAFGVPPSGGPDRLKPGLQTPVLTEAGKVMGTPQYMSPEQIEAPGEVDHWADIYALGVVFYQMLTGELPGKTLEPPSKKVQIDVRLDEVVLRALEKKPELRYQQASIFKTQLETIASTPQVAPPVTAARSWMDCGVDYRSKATLFGLPLLHVVLGIDPATGRTRVAKGIIAIGGIAKGVVAFGGVAIGGLAFGGLAVGVLAFGGCALGLLALGGLGVGLVAALGGGVMAPIAVGGGAIGYFACGGGAIGVHVVDSMRQDPVAQQFFRLSPQTLFHQQQGIAAILLLTMLVVMAISIGVPLWLKRRMAGHASGGGGAAGGPGVSPQGPGGPNQRLPEWIYVVLACAVLPLLVASGNTTVALMGCAVILAIGLLIRRRPTARTAFLVVLAVLGVLAVVLLLLDRKTPKSTTTELRREPALSITTPAKLKPIPKDVSKPKAQPATRTVSQGDAATFTVTSAGTAPLYYQWQFNTNNSFEGADSRAQGSLLPTGATEVMPETNGPAPKPSAEQAPAQPGTNTPSSLLQFRWVAAPADTDSPADELPDPNVRSGQTKLRVLKAVVLDGSAVASAGFTAYQADRKDILVVLTDDGARTFGQVTAANIGRRLAIVWKGRVLSAPLIQTAITTPQVTIAGNMRDAECKQLLDALNKRGPAAPPHPPFVARLAQGEIELLALSHHPSTNQTWWRPDGSPWTNAVFHDPDIRSSPTKGQRFEFVFQRRGLPEDTTLECSFEPGTGEVSMGNHPWRQGKELLDHNVIETVLPEPAKEVTIRLGVAADEWKTLVARTPQAGAGGSFTLGHETCKALFLDPVESGGEARVGVSYNKVPGWTMRVTALDTSGRLHVSFPYGHSIDDMASAEGRFPGLSLSRVKKFRFEARPFTGVEFRNVSLQPGERTQVEVVDAEGR